MESHNPNQREQDIVTNQDKIEAIKRLRTDLLTFIDFQTKQLAENEEFKTHQSRQSRLIRWTLLLQSVVLVIGISIVSYLFLKPPPATLMDLSYIKTERENMINRAKLFQYEKQEAQASQDRREAAQNKRDSLFLIAKAKSDSDIAIRRADVLRMMTRIYSQDSLAHKRK